MDSEHPLHHPETGGVGVSMNLHLYETFNLQDIYLAQMNGDSFLLNTLSCHCIMKVIQHHNKIAIKISVKIENYLWVTLLHVSLIDVRTPLMYCKEFERTACSSSPRFSVVWQDPQVTSSNFVRDFPEYVQLYLYIFLFLFPWHNLPPRVSFEKSAPRSSSLKLQMRHSVGGEFCRKGTKKAESCSPRPSCEDTLQASSFFFFFILVAIYFSRTDKCWNG